MAPGAKKNTRTSGVGKPGTATDFKQPKSEAVPVFALPQGGGVKTASAHYVRG